MKIKPYLHFLTGCCQKFILLFFLLRGCLTFILLSKSWLLPILRLTTLVVELL